MENSIGGQKPTPEERGENSPPFVLTVRIVTIRGYRPSFDQWLPLNTRHQPLTGYTATKPQLARSSAVPVHQSEWIEPRVRTWDPSIQPAVSPTATYDSSSSRAAMLTRFRRSSSVSGGRFTSNRSPCD